MNKILSEEFCRKEINAISTYVDKTASDVVKYLDGSGMKIALAESCTGGMLAKCITSAPGASRVFELGAVCYSEKMKSAVLGVPEQLISHFGVVSSEVAEAMAKGAVKLSSADIGVGITGIAGPSGGTALQPVGTIYVSVVMSEKIRTENLKLYELCPPDREKYRLLTAAYALETVLRALKGSD